MSKVRFLLILSALLLLLVSSLAYTQTSTDMNATVKSVQSGSGSSSIESLLSSSGYSLSDLKMLGIDPDNPERAIERARSLGIPESEIQQFIKEYQKSGQASVGTTGVAGISGQDSLLRSEPKTTSTMPGDLLVGSQALADTTKAPTTPKPISTTEDSLKQLDPLTVTTGRFKDLQYFGYNVLRNSQGRFAAMQRGPADPGYIIGAGDVLRLYLWGDVEFQYELPVDNNGNIYIPNVGQVFVSGTSLGNLGSKMRTFLSRQYSGLMKNPPTTFLDINLAYVKGTEVYLMGDVLRPGSYTLSGFATAFNLMYTSGGPKTSGSLREIRIIRDGKIAAKVDLYDYLARGRPSGDQRLRNGDILFVPPRRTTVAIQGEVKRPAVYEILPGETAADLIEIAGGITPVAYSFRMQIDRIVPIEQRKAGVPDREVIDMNLVDVLRGKKKITLENGDIVRIFRFTDDLKDYVDVVGGGITRPGRYQLSDVKTISDLIMAADSLTDDAYPYKADLVRTRKDLTRMMVTINPEEALKGNPVDNLMLQPRDSLRIYGRLEWEELPKVSLRGFVRDPGEYLLPDSMTVYDLIFEHAGLQDSSVWERTFSDRGDIYRLTNDGKTRTKITFNLQNVWYQVPGSNVPLKDNDIVILYERTLTEIFKREVTLSGEVKYPGTYELANNMTLADLLVLGGGFTEDAWVLQAEVSRIDLNGMQGGVLAKVLHVPLVDWTESTNNPETLIPDLARGKTEAASFKLEPYDQVRIRKNPDYMLPGNVELVGEVTFPGNYTLRHQNETLSQLIQRAGGLRPTAHIAGGKLLRGNQRLFLDFKALLTDDDEKEDVVLHPDDIIIIPQKPNAVTVLGQVVNPGIYKYYSGKRAKDYLKEAGGKNRDGDRVYLTQPSGRTYEIGFMKNPKVEDGAVVRVTAKIEKEKEPVDWSGIIKDSMALVSSALTIIVLASRLN